MCLILDLYLNAGMCPEITAKRSSYTGDSFEFSEFYLAMSSPNAVYEQQTHQSL